MEHDFKRRLIGQDEADLIRFQLERDNTDPQTVKAGLQRLCSHYEQGRRLTQPRPISLLISALMWSPDILVRRWSYKAIALIGDHTSIEAIIARFQQEPDHENLSWIVAALFGLSNFNSISDLCSEYGVPLAPALNLAALLFTHSFENIVRGGIEIVEIESAEPLTLKWCALLAGYDRSPPNLMHPRIENAALLGALHDHDSVEVVEYAVWALWNSPQLSITNLHIPMHAYLSRPDNVRRWINRVFTKNPDIVSANEQLLNDLRSDNSTRAREGLALGVRDIHSITFPDIMIDWFSVEHDARIKQTLLEHMTHTHSLEPEYRELILPEYENAPHDGELRKRLRSAAAGSGTLFQDFRRIDFAHTFATNSGTLFGGSAPLIGDVQMTNNTFNIRGNLNAQNVAGGNLRIETNNAIQSLAGSQPDVAALLDELRLLAEPGGALTEDQSDAILTEVKKVAEQPTVKNKQGLNETLKKILSSVSTGSEIATKLDKIIVTVSSWF